MAYTRKRSSEEEEEDHYLSLPRPKIFRSEEEEGGDEYEEQPVDSYLSLPRPKMFRSEEEGDEYEDQPVDSNSDDVTSSTENSSTSSDEIDSKMRIALGNSPVPVKKPEAKYSDFSQRMMVCYRRQTAWYNTRHTWGNIASAANYGGCD